MKNLIAAALIAFPLVAAQGGAYQQCGGINWNGETTCIQGWSCQVINDYYHQCLPGAASSGTTATPTPTGSNPTPTVSNVIPTPTTTPGPINTANPFAGKTQWANPYYASEVLNIAVPSFVAQGKTALATKAASVAKVPSFTWLDTRGKLPSVRTYLQQVRDAGLTNTIVPFVVYNLPNRDCAAAASNGELSLDNNGAEIYKKDYIDVIRAALLDFPEIPVALVIEPDSLANMVTNMGVPKCSVSAEAYHSLTVYAVKQLALPNVSMYLDGGHGGWTGWPANLPGAAKQFSKVFKDAGSPAQLRGLATNVSNFNGWSLETCPSYTSPNVNCDEKRFIAAITSALATEGWPNTHHIVDQGRSGKQPTGQIEQGHWCNPVGTGFGTRPTSETGDANVDAIVWIKPGGESDGTSDTTADRYDHNCGSASAFKPAPEAGQWFQGYFEQLLVNANPAF